MSVQLKARGNGAPAPQRQRRPPRNVEERPPRNVEERPPRNAEERPYLNRPASSERVGRRSLKR
jgi:hypothetical protein